MDVFSNYCKKIFGLFNLCLASNQETKDYLLKLEAKIFYSGNLKLMSKIEENKVDNNIDILNNKRHWVAASTHDGEEVFCLKTHYYLKKI